MKPRLTPAFAMIGLALAGLLAGAVLISIATSRPWLGLAIVADKAGVVRVASRVVGEKSAVVPGRIVSVRGDDGGAVAFETGDLIEEPDTLATYAEMRRFFERQSAFDELLGSESVIIETVDEAGVMHQSMVAPRTGRPITDLPATFWVQLLVGLSSFLIGGWVWALRRADPAARLFALASLGILGFTFPAALYSTRELAIDGTLSALFPS